MFRVLISSMLAIVTVLLMDMANTQFYAYYMYAQHPACAENAEHISHPHSLSRCNAILGVQYRTAKMAGNDQH